MSIGVFTQPVAGLQLSAVQALASLQLMGEPTHVPDEQVSADVQALPSLQVLPLGLVGFEQTPLPGLQTPTMWH